MSVQAISWVLDHSESRLGARCVLLSIANHAGPFGTGSWPSVKTIAREAKLSEREVQYAKAELKRIGELTEQTGAGPKGVNIYSLPKMGANTAPGAQGAVEGCTERPKVVHTGPPEPSKSEPLTTEPPTTTREAPVEWIPMSLWGDYRAMREKLKRPLTPGATEILIEDLRRLRDAGEDITEVIRQAISGGWFSFRATRKEQDNGSRESFEERRQRKSAEAIGEVRRRAGNVVREVERGLPDSRSLDVSNSGLRRSP